jgi:hypothetical protein
MLAFVLTFCLVSAPAIDAPRDATGAEAMDRDRAQGERGVEGSSEKSIDQWLADLSAPRAVDRSRAQRALAARLEERDLERVRASARAGSAEVRRRLESALASSDRHLDLAVDLSRDAAGEVSEIGRDALREMLARWSPGYSDPPVDRGEVRAKLREKSERILAIDPEPGDLAIVLDALARAAEGAPPLVLDPSIAASESRAFRSNSDLEGPFERVLDGFARAYGVGFVGFAFDAELGDAARPWILVTTRADDGGGSAVDRITGWLADVASGGERASGAAPSPAEVVKRAASARALAALDWPAALDWLEERWRESRDPAALAGVLLAAGRGRVAPSLADPSIQETLWNEMDAALRRKDPLGDQRAEEIARALAAVGSSGEDLAPRALGKPSLDARETWMRLVVLESAKSSSPLVLPFVDGRLTRAADASAPLAEREPLRFQALRTRAACARGAALTAELPDARSLLEWAAAKGRLDELVRCLAVSSVPLPREWHDANRWPSEWWSDDRAELRAALVAWSLEVSEPGATSARGGDANPRGAESELATTLASRALSPEFVEQLARRLSSAVRDGERERVESFLAAARRALPSESEALDRLEILSGRDRPEAEDRVLAAETSQSRSDLLCLGAMAAGARGEKAREALLKSIQGKPSPSDLVAALDRAIFDLRAARLEKEERAFVAGVRDAARSADPKVRALLRADAWPVPQRSVVVRVSELDRHLRTSGL